ncbi:MAG: hypothetical protein KF774_16560 [Planctomyces sp.]|nr:hypothetical protein [Planctomyces sp.]
MKRQHAAMAGFLCLALVVGQAVRTGWSAQESEKSQKSAARAEESAKPRGRLPAHFAKLGLSDEQRGDIYSIQSLYDARIDDLLAQLEELRGQRDGEIEDVLTARQKTLLESMRQQAREERASARGAKAPAARP